MLAADPKVSHFVPFRTLTATTDSAPIPVPMTTKTRPEFDPLPGLLAIIFPGAGHFFRGEPRRAFGIAAGVLGLFFGGLLIGGIDVVDSKEDRLWFVGQAMVGPVAIITDQIHQKALKVDGQLPEPGTVANLPATRSIGKVNEIGTLFATIAGMMNLIVILDAFLPPARLRDEEENQ